MKNILDLSSRREFREWLENNAATETECWIAVRRGRPSDDKIFLYVDAVEEALCFGWIDSTVKKVDGIALQRFSPRKKNGPWSELNLARVRRLEALDLMTDAGRAVLPKPNERSAAIDKDVCSALKKARVWSKFKSFPPLYQRVRAYNVAFYKNRNSAAYEKALARLIEETKKGRTFGNWNDYGRLTD